MRFSFLILLVFTSWICQAQLTGKEKADSIRDASRARLDSIRTNNMRKMDSIKNAIQMRKDSLAEVNRLRREKAKQKALEQKDDGSFPQNDVSPNQEKLQARKDSLQAAKLLLAEKRKKEAEAKKNSKLAQKPPSLPPISQEISIGYRLATDGWGFFFNRGFIKTEDDDKLHTWFLWSELSEKRNSKEINTNNQNVINLSPNDIKPVSYKYGKINNFYAFKFGLGNMKPITGILDKRSIKIFYSYQAGVSLGLLKPYYLDLKIFESGDTVRRFAKYSENIKESFLDLNNSGTIIGGSSFTKGLNEIKIQPGVSLRSGFYFDYQASKKTFVGIEIGAALDLYAQQIPIMINTTNRAYFVGFYIDARFGKRWRAYEREGSEDMEDFDME